MTLFNYVYFQRVIVFFNKCFLVVCLTLIFIDITFFSDPIA